MLDSVFVFLSALLGLALINVTVILNAHNCRNHFLAKLPIDVRYVAVFSVVLLAMLNGNQFVADKILFPLLIVLAVYSTIITARGFSLGGWRLALRDGVSLLVVQLLTLIVIYVGWQMRRFWLLEATNHDSLVYYQGMQWVLDSPLFVGSEEVRARWGLGVCREGAGWIGFDCPLYRGGTYTLEAWIQYFSARQTGSGFYYVGAYAATVAWFAVRLLSAQINWLTATVASSVAMLVGLSTGFLGALINSNLATVMGAASLLIVVALALRTDLQPMVRYGLMAVWAAIGAHFYAESIFYSCLLIFLVFLLELNNNLRMLKLTGCARLSALLIIIVLGFGNIAVGQALSSLILFAEIDKGGHWFSWYINRPEILWVGSFVGGILMASPTSTVIMVISTLVVVSSALLLVFVRRYRSTILSLIGVSFLAVVYIEVTGYEYGEHKILHLLGPAWSFLIVVSVYSLFDDREFIGIKIMTTAAKRIAGALLLFLLVFISVNFITRGYSQLLQARGPHGLDFGLTNLSSRVRPGETVLADDSAWIGVEKFYKGHYLAFEIHSRGAQILMPDIVGDGLRGGYFRGKLSNTFSASDRVDWLVQGRGFQAKDSKFVPNLGPAIWENADYRIYRVNKAPVAVAGNGWYDCEVEHCWTKTPFEIEAYTPPAGSYQLLIDFWTFRPPKNGVISVSSGEGVLLTRVPATANQIRIPLPVGWTRLVFNADWTLVSPKEVGVSTDDRKLFAAVQRYEIVPVDKSDK